VEEACSHIPVTAALVVDDDLIADPSIRERIATALTRLASFVDRSE
jgi:hypothetical protein